LEIADVQKISEAVIWDCKREKVFTEKMADNLPVFTSTKPKWN